MNAFQDDISGFGSINSSSGPGTLISGHGNNLAIDLIWDSSVASAPVGFVGAVEAAAELLVSVLHAAHKTVVYVDVGWGEYIGPAGSTQLQPGDLGESNPNVVFYPGDFQAVVNALAAQGDNVSAAAKAEAAVPALASVPIDFTTAEGKALGLLPENYTGASNPDGAIGFATNDSLETTGNSWQFGATGTGPAQFNLQAVALHELTEVMGRISSEGLAYGAIVGGQVVGALTPLDLLTFTAKGQLAFANPAGYSGGYFSTNNGATQMGQFNNFTINFDGINYFIGDLGDWQSSNSPADSQTVPPGQQDPFNAFLQPGYNLVMSRDDLIEMEALGW
jgi:hypothetical protein